MSKTRFFGAAALLSVLIGSPASAQHMIDEPGMYAFYHPNGDLGIGSARPAMNAMASAPLRDSGAMAGLRMQAFRPLAARRVKTQ